MKTVLVILFAIAALFAVISVAFAHKGSISISSFAHQFGDVPGFSHNTHMKNLIGDVEDDGYGDEEYGDLVAPEFSTGDMNDVANGRSASAKVLRKMAPRADRKAAVAAALSLPGKAIDSAIIPALFPENAKVIQFASERGVPGSLVKYNLDKHRVASPYASVFKNVAGAGVGATTTVTLDAALIAPIIEYTVPMYFVTISSSVLSGRAGARYEITLAGVNEFNAVLNAETWIIEREDINKPVRFTAVPFVRIKDDVKPMLAAFGTVQGLVKTFVISIKGVDTSESIQVVAPGLDSQEMKAFLKAWNIPV